MKLLRFCLILVILTALRQSVTADEYFIPPASIPTSLNTSDRAVSVNVAVQRSFPAQRVFIQLALIGTPKKRGVSAKMHFVEPSAEDHPPALQAIEIVTDSDLDRARHILERAGIPDDDISVRLAHAYDPKRAIGQILIAVTPPTTSRFDAVAKQIADLISQYPYIRGAGIVVARGTCDAERFTSRIARREAKHRAAILARAGGFTIGAVMRSDVWFVDRYPAQYQTICGGEKPSIPRIDVGPTEPGSLGAYQVSVNLGVVFRMLSGHSSPIPKSRFLEMADLAADLQPLISHRFVIAGSEPFVSAQGQFSAVVRPDALVASFNVPDIPSETLPPHLIENLLAAVRMAGVKPTNILREHGTIYVRVRSGVELVKVRRRVEAIRDNDGKYPINFWAYQFVSHCNAVSTAVAAHAFAVALQRAKIMTAQAQVRMGPVIAFDDAGTTLHGAICGYGKRSPMRRLVQAAVQSSADGNIWPPGTGATFERSVVVAWRLKGVKALPRGRSSPAFAAPFAYSTIDEAFLTSGNGVLGSAKEALAPTQTFISLPMAQPITPLLRGYARAFWWETGPGGPDRAAQLWVSDPGKVKAALQRLRASGVAVSHLLFHAGNCEQARNEALREATRTALARMGSRGLQALIDQGAIYHPSDAVCGLTNSISGSGDYVGGSYTNYDRVERSITQRVLIVSGEQT